MSFDTSRMDRACVGVAGLCLLAAMVCGCASPGLPRSPTLNLPGPVRDLSAQRAGDLVTLRFTVPQRTTDHLALRGRAVSVTVCRAVEGAACVAVGKVQSFAQLTDGGATRGELEDVLPAELASGAVRLLSYRVQVANEDGRAAGFSDAAYTAAGPKLLKVEALSAIGCRLGVVLSWAGGVEDGSQVVLSREDLGVNVSSQKGRKGDSKLIWLSTIRQSGMAADTVLDATAVVEEPYRYAAERRRVVTIWGRTVELRSEVAGNQVFTLHDVYPPPAPTDLSGARFESLAEGVDLIWEPVDDPRLAGYVVTRQALTGGAEVKLTEKPVVLPGFHDGTVIAGVGYRYRVMAVDLRGNESAAAVFVTP